MHESTAVSLFRVDEILSKIKTGSSPLHSDGVYTESELRQYIATALDTAIPSHLTSLWGIAPTGPLHVGFDRLICKQRDLIGIGFKHLILLADLHAYLMKPSLGLEEYHRRIQYYRFYFQALVGLEQAEFVVGSSFQRSADYIELLYDAMAHSPYSTVSKSLPLETSTPDRVAKLIYPVMQCIDLVFLNANIAYGESGQRRIYVKLARELLPHLGKPKPVVILSPLSHDIMGKTLAQSSLSTRITIHETPQTLRRKIDRMLAPPREVDMNPLLEVIEYSVWPWTIHGTAEIPVRGANAATREVHSFAELRQWYADDIIGPQELKEFAYFHLQNRFQRYDKEYSKRSDLTQWIDFDRLYSLNKKKE